MPIHPLRSTENQVKYPRHLISPSVFRVAWKVTAWSCLVFLEMVVSLWCYLLFMWSFSCSWYEETELELQKYFLMDLNNQFMLKLVHQSRWLLIILPFYFCFLSICTYEKGLILFHLSLHCLQTFVFRSFCYRYCNHKT